MITALMVLVLGGVATPKNFLLVTLDDAGRDAYLDLEAPGDDRAVTPFLNSLAAGGQLWDRFYTQPACSPTRASIALGKKPRRSGVGAAYRGKYKGEMPTGPSNPTIFDALRGVGYHCAFLGKWHLSQPRTWPLHVNRAGVQTFLGTKVHSAYTDWNVTFIRGASVLAPFTISTYKTDYMSTALEDLASSLPEPWFIWLSYTAPHKPYHTPPTGTYTHSVDDDRGKFVAAIESLDWHLGRSWGNLPASLQSRIEMYILADNGTPGDISEYPAYERKGSLAEGGIRASLIVHGKGVVPRRLTKRHLASCSDLYATMMERAGATWSSVDGDSVSFSRILDGENVKLRQVVGAERFFQGVDIDLEAAAMTSRWKLRRKLVDGKLEDTWFRLDDSGTDGAVQFPGSVPKDIRDRLIAEVER